MTPRALLFLAPLAAACASDRGPFTNRMAQAAAPYLSRAARQPVGWQPWGRDAFALAAKLDRPVLLYVGAEECRWCIVMDRDAYADAELGALIDSLFVPVRLDRDEHPLVAQRYAAAVQSLAGLRGLPLTVFLTPDGAPFFGGTYFPADDPVTGRGLLQILPEVARSYREERDFVVRHAALVRELAAAKSTAAHGVLSVAVVAEEIGRVAQAVEQGAEGPAARFPHARAVALLFGEYGRSGDPVLLALARRALDALVDSLDGARHADEPAAVVRAAVLGGLGAAWAVTGDGRYRGAARRVSRALALALARPDDRHVFADQEAYVIASLLDVAPAVGDSASAEEARVALDALLRRVYARGSGVRHGVVGTVTGLFQDHVQVAGACLAAYRRFGEPRYLDAAVDLAAVLDRDFLDSLGGYYDAARPDPAVPALADRTKQVLDDLLPGPNAWAARVLLRLAEATGEARYRRRAEATLQAFAGGIAGAGISAATYLAAAREALVPR